MLKTSPKCKSTVVNWKDRSPGSRYLSLPLIGLAAAMVLLLVASPLSAKEDWTGSPLSPEAQVQLEKAGKLCHSGKHSQAEPIILDVLNSATDVPKCLAIASYTEPYAFPMMEVRRQCLNKALSLCVTHQDFIEVTLKSRQYQFYEITRQSINSLINNAKTLPDLYDLARKAQEVSLNDVAHMAMEKAYSGVKNVPDAIHFAAEVKALGMDDLTRKVIKDLIDDEENAHQLCLLVKNLETLGAPDLIRYALKKALDKAQTVQDCADIYEAGRRNREQDIYKVAEYRGKKLKLINQIKHDQADYQRQMQNYQEGVQQDVARQPQEANPSPPDQSAAGNAQSSPSAAPGTPGSGF